MDYCSGCWILDEVPDNGVISDAGTGRGQVTDRGSALK